MKKTRLAILLGLIIVLVFTSIWLIPGKNENISNEKTDVLIGDSNDIEEIITDEENEEIELKKSKSKDSIESEESQDPEDSIIDEEELTKYDSQNGIEMSVAFANPSAENSEYIIFKVIANNHSVDLGEIEYEELAKLSISDGTIIDEGFVWESDGGSGHHILGYLKLPKNYNGKSIIDKSIDNIELEFVGIGNTDILSFQWDKEEISSYDEGGIESEI